MEKKQHFEKPAENPFVLQTKSFDYSVVLPTFSLSELVRENIIVLAAL